MVDLMSCGTPLVTSVLAATELERFGQFAVNGLVIGSILALAAVGLTLVYGILRIANFAHGDYLTLGTYVALYFFALLTLPETLGWATALALILLLLAAADRWGRDQLHHIPWLKPSRTPALSDGEAAAVAYVAVLLLLLSAGVRFPFGMSGSGVALLVAAVIALPLTWRVLLAPGREARIGIARWAGIAVIVVVVANLLVHLQQGVGALSPTLNGAVLLGVLAVGALVTHRARSRDPWVVGALGVAGLVAAFLWATPILLSMALALGAVAVFAVALERLVWRRARSQGAGLVALIIISIGLMLALRNTIVMIWGTEQRSFPDTLRRGEPILGSEIVITPHQALAVAVTAIVILLLHLFLRYSKMGKAMRALGDDMELSRVAGIDVDRVVSYVWIITGALAALAGILYGFVRPFDPNLGWYQLLPIFAAVILGGIGSPYGALLGGFTIGLAMEISPFFGVPIQYKLAVGFAILILVMIVRPRGILGVAGPR